jgi:deazaflavin-dependent oxidoreductase (nitroreductase family)
MSPERRRQLRWWEKPLEGFVKSKPGTWFALNVANPVDRRLIKWTNGRLSTFAGQPVGLLETIGRKSGEARSTPLLYLGDGDRVVLVASKGGAAKHPAWYLNLQANPEVHFTGRGRPRNAYRARTAEGEERQRLWAQANELYSGYEGYQGRAGDRRIPVVVLEPAGAPTSSSR